MSYELTDHEWAAINGHWTRSPPGRWWPCSPPEGPASRMAGTFQVSDQRRRAAEQVPEQQAERDPPAASATPF
jgi:hypothetical protein